MKSSFILLTVLTISAALVQTSQTTPQLPATCPDNPFRSELEKRNVKLFDKPALYTGKSCGDEWKTFGLCCDESNLGVYARRDERQLKQDQTRIWVLKTC